MPAKILIVDDEESLTKLLKLSVEGEGDFEVRVETDPLLALQAALDFQPDLIVLDITMPRKNGVTLAEDMREEESLKDTPLIFLSASVSNTASGFWLNTDERMYKKLENKVLREAVFLEKPVTTEELVEAIDKLLNAGPTA
ncbi:MAG: CheY-like chemotaxis protein [Kiritimatiellia bacterium]